MKKLALRRTVAPAALCAGLCLTAGTLNSQAQLTGAQQRQLNDLLGDRAMVGVILGASDSASSGSYTIDGKRGNEDLDYGLFKIGGSGELGAPRPIGDAGMTWNPVIMGNIGMISGKNDITVGALSGNKFEETAVGIQVGGGMALHFTERFTVTPSIGVIYGHYEPEIHDRNPSGAAVARFLDEDADTLGITPGIGIGYKIPMGKTTLALTANYTYYGTEDVSDSNLDVEGSSHILEQRADIDIPLNADLFNCPLHTGGYLSLTEPLGDIGDTMDADFWATVHGRLLLNTEGKFWKMDRAGIGMSYIAADNFTGWDIGVEASFGF